MHKNHNLQRKESKIMTQLAVPTLFVIILIQMVVVETTEPVEKIGGVLKTEVQKLLNQQENWDKICDIFATAKADTAKAKNRVLEYARQDLCEDMHTLLDNIAKSPQIVFKEMEPLLIEIRGKVKKLDTKLVNESLPYRFIGRPILTLFSGVTNMGVGAIGYAMQAAGTLLELFNNTAKESVAGYHEGVLPDGQTKEVLGKIDKGAGKFKLWGSKLENRARKQIQKGFLGRYMANNERVPTPETSAQDVNT